jgi:hypothetical protein
MRRVDGFLHRTTLFRRVLRSRQAAHSRMRSHPATRCTRSPSRTAPGPASGSGNGRLLSNWSASPGGRTRTSGCALTRARAAASSTATYARDPRYMTSAPASMRYFGCTGIAPDPSDTVGISIHDRDAPPRGFVDCVMRHSSRLPTGTTSCSRTWRNRRSAGRSLRTRPQHTRSTLPRSLRTRPMTTDRSRGNSSGDIPPRRSTSFVR